MTPLGSDWTGSSLISMEYLKTHMSVTFRKYAFMETLTRGPTRTPSATFNSPLPLPFSGATSACSSDAHCGEQAHAVEVHTLVGYPELEPNG